MAQYVHFASLKEQGHPQEGEMPGLNFYEERREHSRYSVRLPLDFWQTSDVIQSGLVANISERGLLFHSVHKIQIDAKLGIRVYLSKEYSLDQVEGSGKVVWMNLHQEQDWHGYKYGFFIMQMASDDRDELMGYFLKLQAEGRPPDEEMPFKNYGDYICALSNRKNEASLTKRGLWIVDKLFHLTRT